MCLVGYFQSEKYFVKHADKIRNLFSIDDETKAAIEERYEEIPDPETLEMSYVRNYIYIQYFGDVSGENTSLDLAINFHGGCEEYYHNHNTDEFSSRPRYFRQCVKMLV